GGKFTVTGVGFNSTNQTINTDEGNPGNDSTSTTGGHVTLTLTGAATLGAIVTEKQSGTDGDLAIIAGGAITDASGSLDVNGTTTLTAWTNDITLDNSSNNFNIINVLDAQNVTLTDIDDIALQSTSIAGGLTVIAGGDITNSAALSVGGATTLTATGNDITLTDSSNDFTRVALTGADVSIEDANAIEFAASTITGGLTATAGGGISQSGAL
ncbi:MAG: hypothetical protein GY694_22130, partial [Gammaproteobacteria bacterium]|nr:hypothetical protein [Gammaproteobacteria bacterium]